MRGNSSVVISSARTGRTLSYLPAICSLIKMEVDECLVPDAVGPIAIIVTHSAVEVEKIKKLCHRFLHRSHKKILIVESYGLRKSAKIIRCLLNGCDILVTTPPSLLRLLRNELKIFDSKRLRHLVIDNVEFTQVEIKHDLREILKNFYNAKLAAKIQLVMISKHWSPMFSGFLRIGHNTQLCIGAYIEAAVYARSKIKLKLVKRTAKAKEVIKFISVHSYLTEPLIIVCNVDEEVEEVVEILKSNSCFHISCCSRSTSDEIDLAKAWYERQIGDMGVLVCTDDVLPEIKITAAKNIIHYSLPNSWTRFSYRFSCLFASFHDFVKSDIPIETHPGCLILLDESNNSQLPKLVHFLGIHNVGDIPKEIFSVCNNIKIRREKERISENREFCQSLMEFGKCPDIDDCCFRHELTAFDKPRNNLEEEDYVVFKVLEVISPTHYTVRLLDHKPMDGKIWNKIEGSSEYLKFNIRFAQYFSCLENHQLYWPIEVGNVCVVSETETFHRGRILSVTKRKSTNGIVDASYRVKLVDIGRVITCKSSRLLYLPEEFKQFPYQAVNLRLSGIIPYDREQNWSLNAVETVKCWFRKYSTGNLKVIAKINFSLMDTLWVDNVKIIEKLESIKTYVTVVDIKNSLLEKQFGTISTDAEELLKQKAIGCGIFKIVSVTNDNLKFTIKNKGFVSCDIPKKHLLQNDSETNSGDIASYSSINTIKKCETETKLGGPEEKWENLIEQQYSRVLVGAFYSPNYFFVQHSIALNSKEKLYKAIDEFIAKNPAPVTDPKIGLNCLAKFEGEYNRAKITKVLCDEKCKELAVGLFFCDIGISSTHKLSHIFHSSLELVNMLPFQAIRCNIMGIASTTYGFWTEECCDRIYDEILDPAQFLYARPVKVVRPSEKSVLKYWCYEVDLLDCSTEKDIRVNQRIIELGFGKYDAAAQHCLNKTVGLETVNPGDESFVNELTLNDCTYADSRINLNSFLDGIIGDGDIQFSENDVLHLRNVLKMQQSRGIEPNRIRCDKDNSIKSAANSLENGFKCHQYKLKPYLTAVYKCPPVFWQQSQCLISIKIVAPDVQDYYLRVTSSYLLFIALIQTEVNILSINFCGCIDSSLIAHKVRGLNILVSLPKSMKGIKWPRLTFDADKPNWLKYNHDSVYEEKEAHIFTGLHRHDSILMDSISDTNSDLEDQHDILITNDVFDPFDEEFF